MTYFSFTAEIVTFFNIVACDYVCSVVLFYNSKISGLPDIPGPEDFG